MYLSKSLFSDFAIFLKPIITLFFFYIFFLCCFIIPQVTEAINFDSNSLFSSLNHHPHRPSCAVRVRIGGWVKTSRYQGKGAFAFLEVNDGSCPANLQVLVDHHVADLSQLCKIMHESEVHDLSDDADYAASQQQGSVMMTRSYSNSSSSRRSEEDGGELVFLKENVSIHPTQYASDRISGRLMLFKQNLGVVISDIILKKSDY